MEAPQAKLVDHVVPRGRSGSGCCRWVIIGVVAVIALAVGLGVGLGLRRAADDEGEESDTGVQYEDRTVPRVQLTSTVSGVTADEFRADPHASRVFAESVAVSLSVPVADVAITSVEDVTSRMRSLQQGARIRILFEIIMRLFEDEVTDESVADLEAEFEAAAPNLGSQLQTEFNTRMAATNSDSPLQLGAVDVANVAVEPTTIRVPIPSPSSTASPSATSSPAVPGVSRTPTPSPTTTRSATPSPTRNPAITPSTTPSASQTPSPTPTPSSTALARALATGDSSLVTASMLRTAFAAELSRSTTTATTIASGIWGSLSGVSWDPSHDSVQLSILDPANAFPAIISNYNFKGGSTTERNTLGAAGYSLAGAGGRFVALGGNLLVSAHAATAGSAVDLFAKRIVTWLNGGTDPATQTQFSVTIAHFPGPSSYWFSHDSPTRNWVTRAYPSASVSPINTCENAALAGCLATSDLLIIGRQMGKNDDTAAPDTTTDAAAVASTVRAFMQRGKPVLYMHYYRDDTALTTALFDLMGLGPSSTNYWDNSGLQDSDGTIASASASSGGPLGAVAIALDTVFGVTPLVAADMTACINSASIWTSCSTESFQAKLARGMVALRDMLRGYDTSGLSLFDLPGRQGLKLLVLLGDKYRTIHTDPDAVSLTYPFSSTAYDRFAATVFADASVLYRRARAPAQHDLGTLYCPRTVMNAGNCMRDGYDYRSWIDTVPVYSNEWLNRTVPSGSTWMTTGLFALPGRTIRISRVDSLNVKVSIYLFFQRDGVTKSFSVSSNRFHYDRPGPPRSPAILIPVGGQDIFITGPYGGPLYISYSSIDSSAVGGTVRLRVSGVAKHPTILDLASESQLTAFLAELTTNPIPFIDLAAEGFEVHARKDKLTENLKTGVMTLVDYSGTAGARRMMDDYRFGFVEQVYGLAGFKVPGKSLAQTLPADVQALCTSFGWSCTDESMHRPTGIQHSNYDQDANCGAGCSGNPWDAAWGITPLGWGESHELGHNLQMGLLNTHYISSSSSATWNRWSNYANRAGENSNNIFPYHTLWHYYRHSRNYTAEYLDGHMSHFRTFAVLQSARAGITRTISGASRLVTLETDCDTRRNFEVGTTSDTMISETIYSDGSYAADNGERMSFYLQLPLMLEGRTMADGQTVMRNGFDIFRLLYLAAREFNYIGGDDSRWTAKRDLFGFGLFPRTGNATYSGRSVTGMPGNDFLVVAISRITGLDFRPYFDTRGLYYTDLASEQVAALRRSNIVTANAPTHFYVLDTDLPPKTLTGLPTVPIDGTSAWPRNNWRPQTC